MWSLLIYCYFFCFSTISSPFGCLAFKMSSREYFISQYGRNTSCQREKSMLDRLYFTTSLFLIHFVIACFLRWCFNFYLLPQLLSAGITDMCPHGQLLSHIFRREEIPSFIKRKSVYKLICVVEQRITQYLGSS